MSPAPENGALNASALQAGRALTTDGGLVVSASENGALNVSERESGRVLTTLDGHTGALRACALTADGRRVVSASDDRTLKVWDLESGRAIATFEGHAGAVTACAVTGNGRHVVSASEDRTLKVWNLESEHAPATVRGHTARVRACVVTPDGRRAVSASDDETVKVWDLEAGCVLATLEGHGGGARACAVTKDGRRGFSTSGDGVLRVWDVDRPLATVNDEVGGWATGVTRDAERVISAFRDGTLQVRDLQGRRARAILRGHTRGVTACAEIADSRRMISASEDGTLKVWDLSTLDRPPVSSHGRRTGALADLPGGSESGPALLTLEGHTRAVWACAATADGERVVSASADRTLKVWDLRSGRALATLEGHTSSVWACALTADDRCIVSASEDRTLKVWDLETYACLFTHRGDAAYSAIGTSATAIVAGDSTGALWVLDWPPTPRRTRGRRAPASEDDQRVPHAVYAALSSPPVLQKHIILFLAANPLETGRLSLDREARAIQVELERSGHRDCFEFVTRWAAEPLDLLRELRRLKPSVVHFSGVGSRGESQTPRRNGAHQDVVGGSGPVEGEPQHGLFFQGIDGQARLVSTAALDETFSLARSSVKLVVLNACFSDAQAGALLAHVDCVVGISGAISDDAARNFAIGFYGGLGERESIAAAYQHGRAAIRLEGLPDHDRPQLKVRDGVDAEQVVLATVRSESATR